jgi:DNA polymerase-1
VLVLRRISKNSNPVINPSPEIVTIRDREALAGIESYVYENNLKKIFVDCETRGLDPYTADLILVQIFTGEKVFLVCVDDIERGDYSGIQRILEDASILKIAHNWSFDAKILKYLLFNNNGARFRNLFDTFLAERILTAGLTTLKDCSLERVAERYLGIQLDKSLQTSFVPGEPLTDAQIQYAVEDARILKPLFEKQSEELVKHDLVDTALLEFSIAPAVADLELAGVLFNADKLNNEMRPQLEKRLSELDSQLRNQLSGVTLQVPAVKKGEPYHKEISPQDFKPTSPVQVKTALHYFGFEVKNTNSSELKKIAHPFARLMLEHREVSKQISSFAIPLPKFIHPKTGRIHPDINQHGAETARIIFQKPNLQQIPKSQVWRDLFIAPPGYQLLTADYNQIELRILAQFSADETFLKVYRNGGDLHKTTAADVFSVPVEEVTPEQRNAAKAVNFGLTYGQSAKGLAAELDISKDEAAQFIKRYFRAYPQVKNTLQKLGIQALLRGYSRTPLGRRRYFRKAESFGAQKFIERQGRNTPIQSCSADITKRAISCLMESLQSFDARLIHTIHDELVFEISEKEISSVKDIIRKDMVRAGEDFINSVPVEVDIVIDTVWRK